MLSFYKLKITIIGMRTSKQNQLYQKDVKAYLNINNNGIALIKFN